MARGKPTTKYWDGETHEAITSTIEGQDGELSRSLRGLMRRVISPNQPDPSNPVLNGASQKRQPSQSKDLFAQVVSQASRFGENAQLLASLANTQLLNGGMVDDREYQMEDIIQLVASLPTRSKTQDALSSKFIKTLWDNLEHPPLSMLGDSYKYRMADGSNNNIMYPHLGKAGSSYARTVTPQTAQPGVLPDPGVIFDSLFARGDNPQPHPSKISSMLFYLASIIIHDVFHTDERDPTKVKTSSYLDLAPLYGSSDEDLARIRTFRDGLLRPDSFCESRILGFPPGVSALLVCFNRYHNYIASQLKIINENDRFPELDEDATESEMRSLDDQLFQTARLVTCGLYVNIVLNDYVRTILNLNRIDTDWTLDPRENFNQYFDEHGTPIGIGNQVSVEFNLIYRWHSAISLKDEQWTNDAYQKLFPGQDVTELSERQFVQGLRKWLITQGSDPAKWELDFGRYKRTKRGMFEDEDLVQILTDATEDVACAFGARQVPVALRLVEMMGIKQARAWNVATLNEFRKFFKLQPYTRFSEISTDSEIQNALKSLYKHPDYVELYPGLVAEDAKEPKTPGSGLCPGFTVSRTILADAVALVRGDRFYTVDYSPANLTNWGWDQIQPTPEVASGHCIYNLLMRALPNWYRGNSIYAMFPFVVPSENREILHKLKKDHEYSFHRPTFVPSPLSITSWQATVDVLDNRNQFHVPWGKHIDQLIGSKYPYMLGTDSDQGQYQRLNVHTALYCPVNGLDQVREFYEALTTQLIQIRSEKLRDDWHQLDVCRDVANPAHAIFVARLWHIPLKGAGDHSFGVEVDKVYLALSIMFAYVFLDGDTAKSFKLRSAAQTACDQLLELVKVVCAAVKAGNVLHLSNLYDMGKAGQLLSEFGMHLLQRLLIEQDKSIDEVAAIVLPTAAAAVATQAQHMTEMLNVYLSKPYHDKHWPDIQRCAWSNDPADFEKLKRYALEANRLAPAAYGVLREAATDTTIREGGASIPVKKGDSIYLNFIAAGRDGSKFARPLEIDITRDPGLYIHHGWGSHSCLGREMVEVAMAAQLKVFAKLKNIRRAPGLQGKLKSAPLTTNIFNSNPQANPSGIKTFMKEDWSDWWPFPTTLKVHHDGFYRNQDEYLIKDTGLPHRNTDLEESRVSDEQTNGTAMHVQVNGAHEHEEIERHTVNGTDGTSETNGMNGMNGTKGTNGMNGTNGTNDDHSEGE